MNDDTNVHIKDKISIKNTPGQFLYVNIFGDEGICVCVCVEYKTWTLKLHVVIFISLMSLKYSGNFKTLKKYSVTRI